jgi:hypothetical protein
VAQDAQLFAEGFVYRGANCVAESTDGRPEGMDTDVLVEYTIQHRMRQWHVKYLNFQAFQSQARERLMDDHIIYNAHSLTNH